MRKFHGHKTNFGKYLRNGKKILNKILGRFKICKFDLNTILQEFLSDMFQILKKYRKNFELIREQF